MKKICWNFLIANKSCKQKLQDLDGPASDDGDDDDDDDDDEDDDEDDDQYKDLE